MTDNTPTMVTKSIRVQGPTWQRLKAGAALRGLTLMEALQVAMTEWLDRNK